MKQHPCEPSGDALQDSFDKERYHRLTLRGDGPRALDITEVLLDGKKVEGVTRIRFEVDCEGFCEATISLYVCPDFDLPMPLEAVPVCECGPCAECTKKRSRAREWLERFKATIGYR